MTSLFASPSNVGRTRGSPRSGARVGGLDLAGSPARNSGYCVLTGRTVVGVSVLHSDDEILAAVERSRPQLLLVDAPLSLPKGRRTIDDRSGPHFRECDLELRRLGIRFFPLTLGPMRMLTERGMRLATILRARGHWVEEGYPGGAQDLLGFPRKQQGVATLQTALREARIGGELARRALSHDELDAVTLAWVARLFLQGKGRTIGNPSEGVMVLPGAGSSTAAGKSSRLRAKYR
ncbi:MAG: DUF429 domain-containing protein [Thermoplasmata archaeon]|nr:DUF429 domain-containing protein [Thermoplasmata archaeon]